MLSHPVLLVYSPAAFNMPGPALKIHAFRSLAALVALTIFAAGAKSAMAQDSNGDVTIVNPKAQGQGILLYPGGQYGRVNQQLLQPGEPYPGTDTTPLQL